MADRIEREIEEILSKIDDLPEDGGKKPISITEHRRTPKFDEGPRRSALDRLDPAVLMITGAAVMLGGLVAASFAEAFIWVSLAGVVVFLGAFLLSFFRRERPAGVDGPPNAGPKKVFWRDRYIEVEPYKPGPMSRLRSKLKRR